MHQHELTNKAFLVEWGFRGRGFVYIARERSCSVTMSDRYVVSHHNTTVLSQCLVLTQHARIVASEGRYIDAAVQLVVVWGTKRRLKKVQVTNFDFCQAIWRPHQSGAHGTSHACHTLDSLRHCLLLFQHYAIQGWPVIILNISTNNCS